MKKLFIVANWKSNKTTLEAKNWLQEELRIMNYESRIEGKEVIVCSPFTLLSNLKSSIIDHQSSIALGVQDVSAFGEGSYTGEVNAKQIKEFADFVIIGHSERRQYFGENDAILAKKVAMANKYNLKIIFCVQGKDTPIPESVEIVAYEPIFAIGTGNPDTPENAEGVASYIKKNNSSVEYVLYGGSVTSQNVQAFSSMSNIDGILVGKASLDANEFVEIIKNA